MASLGHQLFHICQQITAVFGLLVKLRDFACKPWMSAHYIKLQCQTSFNILGVSYFKHLQTIW